MIVLIQDLKSGLGAARGLTERRALDSSATTSGRLTDVVQCIIEMENKYELVKENLTTGK